MIHNFQLLYSVYKVFYVINDYWFFYIWVEFIIEFEENHWDAGKWRPLLRVSGHQNSAPLSLYGHINYQFRVSAVNGIGRGHSSKPSERYKTPPAGKKILFHFMFLYSLTYHSDWSSWKLYVYTCLNIRVYMTKDHAFHGALNTLSRFDHTRYKYTVKKHLTYFLFTSPW